MLFDRQVAPEVLAMPDDATLRDYVHSKGYRTVEVDDEGILLDIDTMDDYEAMRAKAEVANLKRGG